MNRNTILIAVAIIAIIITGVLIFADSGNGLSLPNWLGQSDKQIAENVVKYINDNQLSQSPASLVSVSRESGVIKVKIKIGTTEFDSYVTKDGRFLFPQAIDMNPVKETASGDQNTGDTNQTAGAEVTKTDSPELEVFVVSQCPYGLQMQRAIADAVKSMPSLAQYITVRYMGSVSGNSITSMHGAAEATENLRQICIRDEQPTKYWSYVACQMKSGDTSGCEVSTGVDSARLNACIADPSRGVADAQKDFTLSDTYGVQGSPTLVLNGTTVDESSYGGRSSDGVKTMVCAGFNTSPSFCSTTLNTATAAVSFSSTYSSSGSATTANSGANGADCAPAQ